jgi:hypothetical protein
MANDYKQDMEVQLAAMKKQAAVRIAIALSCTGL